MRDVQLGHLPTPAFIPQSFGIKKYDLLTSQEYSLLQGIEDWPCDQPSISKECRFAPAVSSTTVKKRPPVLTCKPQNSSNTYHRLQYSYWKCKLTELSFGGGHFNSVLVMRNEYSSGDCKPTYMNATGILLQNPFAIVFYSQILRFSREQLHNYNLQW